MGSAFRVSGAGGKKGSDWNRHEVERVRFQCDCSEGEGRSENARSDVPGGVGHALDSHLFELHARLKRTRMELRAHEQFAHRYCRLPISVTGLPAFLRLLGTAKLPL